MVIDCLSDRFSMVGAHLLMLSSNARIVLKDHILHQGESLDQGEVTRSGQLTLLVCAVTWRGGTVLSSCLIGRVQIGCLEVVTIDE